MLILKYWSLNIEYPFNTLHILIILSLFFSFVLFNHYDFCSTVCPQYLESALSSDLVLLCWSIGLIGLKQAPRNHRIGEWIDIILEHNFVCICFFTERCCVSLQLCQLGPTRTCQHCDAISVKPDIEKGKIHALCFHLSRNFCDTSSPNICAILTYIFTENIYKIVRNHATLRSVVWSRRIIIIIINIILKPPEHISYISISVLLLSIYGTFLSALDCRLQIIFLFICNLQQKLA